MPITETRISFKERGFVESSICTLRFKEIIMDAVDESFSSFGESCKKGIYSRLETEFNISKNEIYRKTREFSDAIEEIFGLSARLVKAKIIRNVYRKIPNFSYSPVLEDFTFEGYLETIRNFLKL